MKKLFLFIGFMGVCFVAENALAAKKTLHPGARKVGLYTAITAGQLFYTRNDRSLFEDSWVTGFKVGYDIWKYFGVESILKFSGHNATTGTPQPGVPLSFFVFQAIGQLKGSYPVTKRIYINAGFGGGLFYSSPNQKSTVGDAGRGMVYGDIGAEYFFRTRGLSMGLDPSFAAVKDLKGVVIQVSGFLRYTF